MAPREAAGTPYNEAAEAVQTWPRFSRILCLCDVHKHKHNAQLYTDECKCIASVQPLHPHTKNTS